jgi:hypothetical protein
MFFTSRRRPASPPDTREQFDRDVVACTRILGRKLPALGRRYSIQILAVAMAMHLRAMLTLGIKDGHLTQEQARQLMHSLLVTTDGPEAAHSASTPPSEAGM